MVVQIDARRLTPAAIRSEYKPPSACRVGKGAIFAPCPPKPAMVGTLRFAHPTITPANEWNL